MTRRMLPVKSEVRTRRLRLRLNQEELAKQAGTSQTHIGRIERNCVLSGQVAKDVLALLLKLEQESPD